MRSFVLNPRTGYLLAPLILTATLLTWLSPGIEGIAGWFFTFLIGGIALAAGAAVFHFIRDESIPPWLINLTLGGALLRLIAGAAWFVILPVFGYETDVQQAGYVMEDAFQRDQAAWKLARSDAPLWAAFRETDFGNYRSADQYGGLLFLSAGIYRFLGGISHAPLQIVLLTASLSALAIPLTWAIARRLFGESTAKWAAWGLALYPEAILLGSSQMREAFVMPLAAAAFYGLVLYAKAEEPKNQRRGLGWIAAALVLLMPLSPPFAGITLILVTALSLGIGHWQVFRNTRLWLLLGGLAALVIMIIWVGWEQIAPRLNVQNFGSPVEMITDWFALSARWQARQTADASGWVQKTFDSTPEWFNLPFLIGYGVSRPLLPANLTAWSIPTWSLIGIWRSLGWNILLAILVYAPIQTYRIKDNRLLRNSLILTVWLGILIASFWGGGDQWDNPRYRVGFASVQIVLAAEVIISQLRQPDPWVRRALFFVLTVMLWFLAWYLRRYTAFDQIFGWTVIDIFKLLGAGILTGILIAVWDWAGTTARSK